MTFRGSVQTLNFPTSVSGGFNIPTLPTPPAPVKSVINSNWVIGPVGKDPYRKPVTAILDGIQFYANGFDAPWFWDGGANFHGMGSVVATVTSPLTTVIDTVNWLADTKTATYLLADRNSSINKESAPVEISITNVAGAGRAVKLDWVSSGIDAQFDQKAIYRQLSDTGFFVRVALVTIGDDTYTDDEADATIRLNTPYKRRFRETLPPSFVGLASHLNRVFAWTGDDSILYYSQQSDPGGEHITDDFPSLNLIEIDPHDNDVIVAVVAYFGNLLVLKRRAAYLVLGTDVFSVRRLFEERGCVGPHAWVQVQGFTYFLDDRGLYLSTSNGEPFVAGAPEGSDESPLGSRKGTRGIWDRMNLDAAGLIQLQHNESERTIEIHIPLDYSPIPNRTVVYDYENFRFVSIDRGVPAMATGLLEDAAGGEHLCRADDLGLLWEQDTSNSDGAFTGDLSGTIDVAIANTFQDTGANLLLLDGVPFDRYAASTGLVVDENRVVGHTGTAIIPLYWASSAPATSQTFSVGVIPWLVTMVKTWFNTSNKKWVQALVIETDVDSTGIVGVSTRPDQDAYVSKREIDISGEEGRHIVSVDDRGWNWQMKMIMRFPGHDVTVQAIGIKARAFFDRQ